MFGTPGVFRVVAFCFVIVIELDVVDVVRPGVRH